MHDRSIDFNYSDVMSLIPSTAYLCCAGGMKSSKLMSVPFGGYAASESSLATFRLHLHQKSILCSCDCFGPT